MGHSHRCLETVVTSEEQNWESGDLTLVTTCPATWFLIYKGETFKMVTCLEHWEDNEATTIKKQFFCLSLGKIQKGNTIKCKHGWTKDFPLGHRESKSKIPGGYRLCMIPGLTQWGVEDPALPGAVVQVEDAAWIPSSCGIWKPASSSTSTLRNLHMP